MTKKKHASPFNNKTIEMISVGYLQSNLIRSNRIEPLISVGDKEPSWDGNIYLYETSDFKKDNVIKIPVQVKGTYVDKFDADSINFKIFKNDLVNYRNDNGVLYLVVQINSNRNCRVFYNDLFSSDINSILKKMGEHKSMLIKFKHYNLSTSENIESVLFNFNTNRKLHSPISTYSNNNYSDYDEVYLKFTSFPDTFETTLFESRPIYGKSKCKSEVFEPISRVEVNSIEVKVDEKVILNDIVFFDSIKQIKTKDNLQIKVSNSVLFDTISERIIINPKGTFKEQLKDVDFVELLLEHNKLKIGEIEIVTNFNQSQKDKIKIKCKALKNIKLLYDYFGINDDLDFEKISDDETETFYRLIDSVVFNRRNLFAVDSEGFLTLKIGNLVIKTFVTFDKDGHPEIRNLFNETIKPSCTITAPNISPVNCSFYLIFNKDDFAYTSNLNLDLMYNDITQQADISDLFIDKLVNCMLEALHAFDMTKKPEIYKFCVKINEYTLKCRPNFVPAFINKYQLIKRERPFTDIEIAELIDFKNNGENYDKFGSLNDVLFAVNILLNNKNEALYYYNKLTPERKTDFETYPIFKLYNKL